MLEVIFQFLIGFSITWLGLRIWQEASLKQLEQKLEEKILALDILEIELVNNELLAYNAISREFRCQAPDIETLASRYYEYCRRSPVIAKLQDREEYFWFVNGKIETDETKVRL